MQISKICVVLMDFVSMANTVEVETSHHNLACRRPQCDSVKLCNVLLALAVVSRAHCTATQPHQDREKKRKSQNIARRTQTQLQFYSFGIVP